MDKLWDKILSHSQSLETISNDGYTWLIYKVYERRGAISFVFIFFVIIYQSETWLRHKDGDIEIFVT